MTLHRREVLGALGIASASTLLWALGCGPQVHAPRRAPQVSGEVRTWLQDAVARLAATYPAVHALAVSRRRTVTALDVLGSGGARLRSDGVILTVRGRNGATREHVTSELTEAGIAAAAAALGAPRQRTSVDFGRPPAIPDEPPHIPDQDLRLRVEQLLARDASLSSRIVYAAALIDLDDTIVWSVAPGRDLEQRLVRIRQAATRAAWNGTRPVIRELERVWTGGLDDQPITAADLTATSRAALELMTPGAFDEAERTLVLDPSVVAIVLDAAVRGRLTATPPHHPDEARGALLASPLVTLVDDPTTPGAYGGFAFDDEGAIAAPITLLEAGRIASQLADRAAGGGRGRRPGHLASVEPGSSHLRLVPGTLDLEQLHGDGAGVLLEGGLGATYDPGTDRLRVACARARELRAGKTTGRVYADLELVGSLTALLSGVDAIGRDPTSVALRDPAGHEPRWRSIATPALRTRGLVRARRGHA